MAKDNYKEVVIDNDAIVNTNAEQDVPAFPEGEQKREFVKETITNPEGEVLSTERLGEKNGELSPNPSFPYIEYIVYEGERYLSGSSLYGQYITAIEKEKDGEVLTDFEKKLLADAVLCRSSQITEERDNPFNEKEVYDNTDQDGIKVHEDPHNFIGGLFVNGKEIKVEDEEGETPSSGGTKLYKHRIEIPSGYGYMELVSTREEPYQSIDEIVNSQIIFGSPCVVNDFGIVLTCICGIAKELNDYQLVGYSINDTGHTLKYYNLDQTKLQFPSSITEL